MHQVMKSLSLRKIEVVRVIKLEVENNDENE